MGAAAGGGDRGVSTAGVPSTERWQLLDPKDVGRGAPAALRCPLTHRLFVDPVCAGNGKVYERSAIAEYLQHNENLPGSSTSASSEVARTLKAHGETLRAVRRWLEQNLSGTSDGRNGCSGEWKASRFMRGTPSSFSHKEWTTAFLHENMAALGLKLSLWEQSGFQAKMTASGSAPWHNMRSSSDGFMSGQVVLPRRGTRALNTSQMSLAYGTSQAGMPWPPPVEDEILESDFVQPTIP